MVRKSIIWACAVFISTISMASIAGGVEVPRSPFSGGYLGIGVGPGLPVAKQALISEIEPAGSSGTTNFYTEHLTHTGFSGDLHLGCGHVFTRNFYLGAQLFREWWTSHIKFTVFSSNADFTPSLDTNEQHDIRLRAAYGIAIRPGVQLIPNVLAYIDLGVAFANLKQDNKYSKAPSGIPPFSIVNNKRRSSQPGFRVGLGTSIALRRHFALGLEYFYTYYSDFNPASINLVFSLGAITAKNFTQVSAHNILVSFDFLFQNGL